MIEDSGRCFKHIKRQEEGVASEELKERLSRNEKTSARNRGEAVMKQEVMQKLS